MVATTLAGGAPTAHAGELQAAPGGSRLFDNLAAYTRAERAGKDVRLGDYLTALTGRTARAAASLDQPADASKRSLASEAPASGAAAASDCQAVKASLTELNDGIWAAWKPVTDATQYRVLRMREGGTWATIATVPASQTRLLDRSTNPDGVYTYRVSALFADTSRNTYCDLGPSSMSTPDGWGYSDAVAGTDVGLLQQNDTAWGHSRPGTETSAAVTPSFSRDGRLIAYTYLDEASGNWYLRVIRANDGTEVLKQTQGSAFGLAYPSFAPDGRRLLVSRFDTATGDPAGIGVIDPDHQGGALVALPVPYKYQQPAWIDDTWVVFASGVEGEGLYRSYWAGGDIAPIAGTANAGDPEVAPNGTVYYVDGDGTTSRVMSVVPGRTPVSVVSSTTQVFRDPRVSPDGQTLYYYNETPADPSDPNGTDTFEITMKALGSAGLEGQSAIGAEWTQTAQAFSGYDVRQPKSTGTSDLAGDANPDVLARDSSGRQWVYPMTQDLDTGAPKFGSRALLGSGWQIYSAILSAGDLNGDGRGDILTRDTSGRLWRYDGRGGAKVAPRVQIGAGWNGYYPVATGDFNGDSRADIVARDGSGTLWLYPGNGRGGLTTRARLGTGWNTMSSIVGAGDFDYDNDADLLARDTGGTLWLYPGNGRGGFDARRKVGAGWNVFTALAGPEQVGSLVNVLARDRDGYMVAYGVVGDGRFDSNLVGDIGRGWQSFAFTS
jgi:hypothetical protein